MTSPATHPAVSIVVPVYNAAAYLDACLDSLCSQDYRDLEVIAVNDGATDESGALLANWAARDARLTVLAHPGNANRGVAAARNLGLDHARGTHLWFVDADDRVRPGAVSQLMSVAEKQHIDVVAFNGEEIDEHGARSRVYKAPKPADEMAGEAWVNLSCRQKECPHLVWLRFYRIAYLRACGLRFREGIVHEDIAWITEGDLRAQHFLYTDAVLYDYLRNTQSITRDESDANLMRRAESLFEIVAQLRDINARVPMSTETRSLLSAELVGQGLQVDRLRQHLADPAIRQRLDARVKDTDFWRSLWKDATRFTRKRQLAQVMLRDLLHR
jgi:glycosyltransferase involved in cell wall biosynthesis